MGFRLVLGAISVTAAMAVAACGTTGEAAKAPGAAAGERRALSAEELDSACWDAVVRIDCAVATSAEGYRATSCDCSGQALGDKGAMTITGTTTGGEAVDQGFDITWDGATWHLVDDAE